MLNYPVAAAMSSVVTISMLVFLLLWYRCSTSVASWARSSRPNHERTGLGAHPGGELDIPFGVSRGTLPAAAAAGAYVSEPGGRNPDLSGITFRWYIELPANPVLTGSIATSIKVALIVGLVTPPLALLGAMAVRELRIRRLLLLLLLLPLFIPGVSLGLASAFFFSELGINRRSGRSGSST